MFLVFQCFSHYFPIVACLHTHTHPTLNNDGESVGDPDDDANIMMLLQLLVLLQRCPPLLLLGRGWFPRTTAYPQKDRGAVPGIFEFPPRQNEKERPALMMMYYPFFFGTFR